MKYYRITSVLTEDEYRFGMRISRLMSCSRSRALAVCVAWAMDNERLRSLLDLIESVRPKDALAVEERGNERQQ
jgi:hypothetical protein